MRRITIKADAVYNAKTGKVRVLKEHETLLRKDDIVAFVDDADGVDDLCEAAGVKSAPPFVPRGRVIVRLPRG